MRICFDYSLFFAHNPSWILHPFKRGTLAVKHKTKPNNGVPITTSSETQPSDQVTTSAATSKAVRSKRPPPTPPTGLTKPTTEPPGSSSRQIPQTISIPTHYKLFESEPITTMATLKPTEERHFAVFLCLIYQRYNHKIAPGSKHELKTYNSSKNQQSLNFLKILNTPNIPSPRNEST